LFGNNGLAKLSVVKFLAGFGLFNFVKNKDPIEDHSPNSLNTVGSVLSLR
tara:strand:+ start:151 stop:300 length:150 start_codon:yes stop_codon:yes gene_type:complete